MWQTIASFFVFIFLVVLYSAVLAYPIMLLWNALIPPLFGLSSLNLLQSFGLFLLARLVVGTTWQLA